MKKMNNKGVTLVELIVSFAIVGVAVVYFYQTVSTVSKLYKTSKVDTNEYVNSTYVLRLMDAYCNENVSELPCWQLENVQNFLTKVMETPYTAELSDVITLNSINYKKLILTLSGKEYFLLVKGIEVETEDPSLETDSEDTSLETDSEDTDAEDTIEKKYIIYFYNHSKSELQAKVESSNYSELKIPDEFNNNKWRVENLTDTNIKYKYYYEADNGYKVYFGKKLKENDMETYATRVIGENPIIYELDVKIISGDLFTYNGSYEIVKGTNNDWNIKFKTDGELDIFADVNIDYLLVGGGAGGAASPSSQITKGAAGGSGGGVASNNETYTLVKNKYYLDIGTGGSGGTKDAEARNGASTTIKYLATNAILFSAAGGEAPGSSDRSVAKGNGGKGGSGTGSPGEGTCRITNFGNFYGCGGNGGVGGTAGTYSSTVLTNQYSAGGGTKDSKEGKSAQTNTGGGGGGAAARNGGNAGGTRKSGGSGANGIIIIRNAR